MRKGKLVHKLFTGQVVIDALWRGGVLSLHQMKALSPEELARLATTLASLYVESPKRLEVRYERGDTVVIKFPGRHSQADHGHLIGGGGKNYHALQRILQEAAKPNLLRLFILDPGGERRATLPIPLDPTWNKDEQFRQVLAHVAEDVFGKAIPVRAATSNDATNPTNLRTSFTLEVGTIDPELLSAFQVLWKAIGKMHGRNFILNAEAPKEQAV